MSKLRVCAALLCAAVWIGPSVASAVCRVVTPVSESGREPVVFDPTTMAVFVIAPDQVIDYACPGFDPIAAVTEPRALPNPLRGIGRDDSAPSNDETPPDASAEFLDPDAGAAEPDAGEPEFDPTDCPNGVDAQEVRGSLVHVVVQPSIYANGGESGLIMPVPSRADVHVGPSELMHAVSALQRARVEETVRFTEDPSLGYQCSDPHYSSLIDDALGAPLALYGCGDMDAGGDYYRPGLDRYETESETNEGGVVELERIPATEDYEVVMLNASSLEALTTWLDDNGFAHSPVDDAAFSAYVQEGAWFMAVKVAADALGGQHVALAPLVVTWVGDTVPVMNRLQYQPGGAMLITDAFVMAEQRVEVADGDGETLYAAPADFGSRTMLSGFGLDRGWLTRIVLTRDTHVEKEDTVLVQTESTEEIRPVITRELEVRIAAPCCPGQSIPDSDGVRRSYTENRSYIEGEAGADDDYFRTTPDPDPAYCPGGASYDGPSYDDSGYGLYCAVEERASERRIAALASWAPLLLALGGVLWRRRRLNRASRDRR